MVGLSVGGKPVRVLVGVGWKVGAVTVTDLFVLLALLWACASVVFLRHGKVDALYPYGWVAMLLLYGVCSRMNRAGILGLYMALVLSGTVQAVWALLQKNGFYTDVAAEFVVTGSFGNPGPLGGYLAVAFAAALGCLREVNNRASKAWLLTVLLPISAALVVTDSRAAWLSALAAAVFAAWSVLPDALRCRKWYVWFAVSAVVAGILFGCYHYKKTSADVRLLVWMAGVEMVADAPWCGHGVGSFPMQYMDYQGEWLAQHPGSRFHALADNNMQAFCEPLSLLCEQGVVGGVLAAVLVTMALSGTRFRHYSPVLLALGIFSCFSYPTDVFALKMLFPMLIGTLSCRRVLFTFTPDRRLSAVVCCLLLLCSGGAGRAVV
ncbi:O-antigen ligase [uncultured Bacteroides sp.]|uniref:O-antigen ligase family protein n=1 Tax=uncultured Bacteroides sp. TaxID=162156 RepID=UPI0025CF9B82|nr:O-antigen ligase family protein [uncultured Bacteroides sp.]